MPGQVFDVILPFTVGVVGRLPDDSRAPPACTFAMALDIFDANHHVSSRFTPSARLHQHHSAVADIQLCAMAPHSDSQGEAEGVAKPLCGLLYVGIDKFRYDG